MSTETKQPTRAELMAACNAVLDEAIAEAQALAKGDLGMQEVPPAAEGIDNAQAVADPSKPASAAPMPPAAAEPQKPGIDAAKPEALKSEDGNKSQEEKDEEEKKKKDQEDLEMHKSLTARLQERGLLAKSDAVQAPLAAAPAAAAPAAAAVAAAPAAAEAGEEFRKSVEARFGAIESAISEVSGIIKKIAAAPAPRRGVTGYTPLAKTDANAPAPLKKGDVVNKLLELKKSDSRVDTGLITRVETGRLTKSDEVNLRNLGILG